MLPTSEVEVDAEMAVRVLKLVDALEDQDDVQNVWSNLKINAELLAAAQAGL